MINWSIISLESFKDTGIVVSAHWKCSNEQVSKTGHSVFNIDFLNLPIPDNSITNNEETIPDTIIPNEIVIEQPNEVVKNIIPYNQLTEQDVLNWVWTDGGVEKTLVEESVTKELDAINNPVVVKNPLPWI